ncbi:GNAT family N-acetyltransferase [candidate division WOR-3 bacterium]|uniref:GNAT family N-acetyltransferase n=1 Tax=candidate division WOR-3 bacterium TaxID=2052148 RepID=A0A9D5K860_UNCW3|nr:GNAT family N-acetyltransferase [candidate division WOR-3 bacterium]MBD3364057.1 GNAT family N-acetyltransferase [candidate division WOR-3 bacterium]
MTEDDWPALEKWNSDPEVLYYSEGDDVSLYTPEMVRKIYRGVCANAFCFIIEADDEPVGECWLQRMNLDWILAKHPGKDCRRIDLVIGEKDYWGRGIGATVIELLTEFGFEHQKADMIFGCSIWDFNPGSQRIMEKAGYELYHRQKLEPGRKGNYELTMYLSKDKYFKDRD